MAKLSYGTSTAITLLLASVADGTAKESDAIDCSSIGPFDVLVTIDVKLQTGTPGNDKCIYFFVVGSEDGTNFGDPGTGASGTISSIRSPTNLRPLGVTNTPDSGALTYKGQPMSVRRAFGGTIPRKFTVVAYNKANVTLDATEGNHRKSYTMVTTA